MSNASSTPPLPVRPKHSRSLDIGVSWLDVKLGLRMLVRQPGLTAVAVFALAIGIPASLLPDHIVNALQAPLQSGRGGFVQRIVISR